MCPNGYIGLGKGRRKYRVRKVPDHFCNASDHFKEATQLPASEVVRPLTDEVVGASQARARL